MGQFAFLELVVREQVIVYGTHPMGNRYQFNLAKKDGKAKIYQVQQFIDCQQEEE